MERRGFLYRIMWIYLGALVLFQCRSNKNDSELLHFGEIDSSIINSVVYAIIPEDGLHEGAKSEGILEYVYSMIIDCLDPESQDNFKLGLFSYINYFKERNIDLENINKLYLESMVKLNIMEINRVIYKKNIDKKPNWINDSILNFYTYLKKYTIEGYLESKYYMTQIMPYNMIPGSFEGAVIIEKGDIINIYG